MNARPALFAGSAGSTASPLFAGSAGSTASLVVSLALAVIWIAMPRAARAQDRPPEECGMTEANAQYGGLAVGTVVTLQRHRFVGADDNWDDQMVRFLGRAARVTRLSGIDAAGCPGVRV